MPSHQKLVIGAAIVLAFGLGVGVGWSLRGGGEKPIVADEPRTPKAPASASKAPSPHHEVKLDGPWVEDDDPFVWPTTEPIGSELVRIDDEHFMLDAKLVALVSENQAELARSARIVPVLEGGKIYGIRLVRMRSDSLLPRLGFRTDDVVLSINGRSLGQPDAALDAYSHLRTSRRFVVAIERAGTPMSIHYLVTGPSSTPGDAGLSGKVPPPIVSAPFPPTLLIPSKPPLHPKP